MIQGVLLNQARLGVQLRRLSARRISARRQYLPKNLLIARWYKQNVPSLLKHGVHLNLLSVHLTKLCVRLQAQRGVARQDRRGRGRIRRLGRG